MEPRKTVDFEDPNTKQMRLAVAVDRRWLTDARAATEMGYYPSVDEARGAGVPDALAPVLEAALGASPDAPHEALEVAPVGEAVSAAPEAQEAAQVALAASGEVAAEGAETIQDTALNGAQTAELRGLLKDVALGEIAKSSAKPLIRASFPAIPEALIDAMLEGIEVRPAPAAEAPQADPPAGE